MAKKNVHDGHRDRMRNNYLSRDFSSMPEHEILEILLFYSHPMGNTNNIAHNLIDTFGSLEKVLAAPPQELLKIDGVGKSTVVLFDLFARLSLRYVDYLNEDKDAVDDNEIVRGLINEFKYENKEKVQAILFDSSGQYINKVTICNGGIDDASFKPRDLVEHICRNSAAKVVLAHNHPQGMHLPSSADVEVTKTVKQILWTIDIELLDHWIVSGNTCYSMKDSEKYSDIF